MGAKGAAAVTMITESAVGANTYNYVAQCANRGTCDSATASASASRATPEITAPSRTCSPCKNAGYLAHPHRVPRAAHVCRLWHTPHAHPHSRFDLRTHIAYLMTL